MIKISEIKLSLDSDEKELRTAAAKALRCKEERITSLRIAKKAVDSRKKDNVFFVYNVYAEVDSDEAAIIAHSRNSKVEAYTEYKKCKQDIEDSLAMLEEESDEA